jgi:hypothetical protein
MDGFRHRTGVLWDGAPAAVAMGGDVPDQLLVLLRRPQPPLHVLLAAAVVPHGRPTPSLPSPRPLLLAPSPPPTVKVRVEAHAQSHTLFRAGELTFMPICVEEGNTKKKSCGHSKRQE